MRAVVQRISEASVEIDDGRSAAIGAGLLIYLGVGTGDNDTDVTYLVDKVRHLRIFTDAEDKMNLDVGQINGQVLVISAFTVQADARKGRRPSFDLAARPEQANELYEKFCDQLESTGLVIKRGSFGSYMNVKSSNDGPICILLDSRRVF